MEKKRERIAGLDILRTLAIILVMATHMLNYRVDHFLRTDIRSASWVLAVVVRYTVIISVPLFLLLTGYLMQKRKPDRRHAAAVIPVILSWFVLSCIISAAEVPLFGMGEEGLAHRVLNIFNFKFGYTWYVEMYLCLYMVLPFINILLDRLTQKQELWFTGIFVALTMLPAVGQSLYVNGFQLDIFPGNFEGVYCIAYYLIGAYIARHKPRPHPLLCIAVALAVLTAEVALNYHCSTTEYAWYLFYQYSALTHAVVATSLFLLFYRIQRLPKIIGVPIREISVCSFEMYLISYLTDRVFHSEGGTLITIPGLAELTSHAIWINLVCSFVTAYILARVARLILVPISSKLRAVAAGRG